jgi:hypothetical protein
MKIYKTQNIFVQKAVTCFKTRGVFKFTFREKEGRGAFVERC